MPTGVPPTAPSTPGSSGSLHIDKELEALLPDAYQGVTLTKSSRANTSFSSIDSQRRDFDAMLQSLGKTTADVSHAIAFDPTFKQGVIFGAYRIKGLLAARWVPRYLEIVVKQSPGTTITDVKLDEKTVTHVVIPKANPNLFAWPAGDVLFTLITNTEAQASDAIAAVP